MFADIVWMPAGGKGSSVMKRSITACVTAAIIVLSGAAHAAFEWKEVRTLPVDIQPLATAASIDGRWLYVLAAGEVLIVSIAENRIETRIPVDAAFDQLAYSPATNSLVLSGRNARIIRVVHLEQIHAFSYEGLAFKGPENAPVTIAVFSDYQ